MNQLLEELIGTKDKYQKLRLIALIIIKIKETIKRMQKSEDFLYDMIKYFYEEQRRIEDEVIGGTGKK